MINKQKNVTNYLSEIRFFPPLSEISIVQYESIRFYKNKFFF